MNKINFIFCLFFSNILCSQIVFEDVANELGSAYSYGITTWGGGVSFADFNNDGQPLYLRIVGLSSDPSALLRTRRPRKQRTV